MSKVKPATVIVSTGTARINGDMVDYMELVKGDVKMVMVPLTEEGVVLPNGDIITVEVKGVAKCDPNDKYSLRYGIRRAYRRALEKLKAEIEDAVFDVLAPIDNRISAMDNEITAMEEKFERAQLPENIAKKKEKLEKLQARKAARVEAIQTEAAATVETAGN